MGGRAASMLAADGFACAGLLLFAYPLHPAGQPEKLRVAHLPDIKVPVLCFNGTRDALCRRDLMEQHVPAAWNMQWLEGADHSRSRRAADARGDRERDATLASNALASLRRGDGRAQARHLALQLAVEGLLHRPLDQPRQRHARRRP